MKFEGMVAVITGGGSGIGAGIGKAFAQEGANVAFLDINSEGVCRSAAEAEAFHKNRCLAIVTDVTGKASVERAFDEIDAAFGRIDILVNCAGISKIVPFFECDEKTWDMTLDVNLKGMFLCSQSAATRMVAQNSGIIINLSSQSGKAGTSSYQAYCASKAGVIGLTQSLAIELAKSSIRVNSICPGVVYTPMWDSQIKDYAKKRSMQPDQVMPYFESKIPLGRIGTIEDIAKLAIFLSSEDSSYITGQAINVSGGQIMY